MLRIIITQRELHLSRFGAQDGCTCDCAYRVCLPLQLSVSCCLSVTLALYCGKLYSTQRRRWRQQTKEIIVFICRWLVIFVVSLTIRKLSDVLILVSLYTKSFWLFVCFFLILTDWLMLCLLLAVGDEIRDAQEIACCGMPVPNGFRSKWQWGISAPPFLNL